MLLSPTNPGNLSDTDYYGRVIEAGFLIEAVLSLPETIGIHGQLKPAWPRDLNGAEAIAPSRWGAVSRMHTRFSTMDAGL